MKREFGRCELKGLGGDICRLRQEKAPAFCLLKEELKLRRINYREDKEMSIETPHLTQDVLRETVERATGCANRTMLLLKIPTTPTNNS